MVFTTVASFQRFSEALVESLKHRRKVVLYFQEPLWRIYYHSMRRQISTLAVMLLNYSPVAVDHS